MDFVSLRDVRNNPGKVWKKLRKTDPLVLTAKGIPVAILTGATAETLEEALRVVRQAKARGAVMRMRRGGRGASPHVIQREIEAVRRSR